MENNDIPSNIRQIVQTKLQENQDLTKTTVLFRVKKIITDGRIFLTPHHIAKDEDDVKSWCSRTSSLQKYRAKKVYVSPAGRIQNAK